MVRLLFSGELQQVEGEEERAVLFSALAEFLEYGQSPLVTAHGLAIDWA
jgi:hypothetical protein